MRNLHTRAWQCLGPFGRGLILFILLSSSIIFFLLTVTARDVNQRKDAASAAAPRAGQREAAKPPETVAREEAKKDDSPPLAPPTPPPTTPRSGAADVSPTTPASGPVSAPPRHMVPGSAAIMQPSLETSHCPFADPARRVVAVSEEIVARATPSVTSRPAREKGGADRIFDPRADLEIVEAQPGWLRLRQNPSRWPPGQKAWDGWAPESAVRPQHRTPETMTADEKACLFVDPASWRGASLALQGTIREVALRILRDDERCRLIGDGGMMGESQRFYLTCYPSDGGQPYHYWLSASSAEKNFATPAPVDESAAMDLCRKKLEKLLAGKGVVQNQPVPDVAAGAISSYKQRSAYHMTIDYRLGEVEAVMKAYCFVPPGRDAEITLGDSQ
ncbi:hypothetical protein ACNHKD_13010 [Methylocystis sp. JAN1]|uniref:hypothetical protein n=1 Tax=Methylocystis sp. JAN1 TaxID=3397211 RepID=UPI003FA2630C